MRIDSQLSFVPLGSPLSLVAGAGVSTPSQVLDLLGVGVGVAPPSIIGLTPIVGTTHVFGTDFGIGEDRVLLDVVTGTAFATGDACTLNVALQLAADTGLSGGYQPGTWYTAVETGPQAVANLTANTRIARFDWPPAFPENLRPRYARLLFQVPSGEYFTTGTIAFALVTPARDDYAAAYAAKNFSVS